jgi:hypothetical protein
MLGIVFAFPILLIAASAVAQSPKVEPSVSSGSSVQRVAPAPLASAPEAVEPPSRGDDERRQEDVRRRAFLVLLLNSSSGHVQPFGGMSQSR